MDKVDKELLANNIAKNSEDDNIISDVAPQTGSRNVTKIQITRGVVLKLVFFSVSIIIFPLLAFFQTLVSYPDNPIYAIIVSVVIVNILLLAYIVVAFMEASTTKIKKN